MILVLIFVLSITLDVHTLTNSLENFLYSNLPPSDAVRNVIDKIIKEVNNISGKSTLFGWIGIAGLIWLSSILLSSLRAGLNVIFHITPEKFFLINKLKDIGLTVILALLIMLLSYVIPISSLAIGYIEEFFPYLINDVISEFVFRGVALMISFTFFYFIYRFVPNKHLPRFARLVSTGLAVFLFELSRNIFAWYLTSISNYPRFYGAYAMIAAMALWIYYSTFLLMVSGEIGQFVYELRLRKKAEKDLQEKKMVS